MKFQINQTVQYSFDRYVRTGKVVDYDPIKNRYRVFWHSETSTTSPGWKGNPNKRTWVKEDALTGVA